MMPKLPNRDQTQNQLTQKDSSRPELPSVRRSALAYASRGLRVLLIHGIKNGRCTCGKPDCRSPGKHPITSGGVHDATTDRSQIKALFKQFPDANIAIATGSDSNLLVLDIDPRNGGGESLTLNLEDLGKLPKTVAANTGGDGRHIYFEWPEGSDIRTRHGNVLGSGIDVQADGAYIVAPPSLHISGRRYRFRKGRSFDDLEIKPLPAAWLARIAAPLEKAKNPVLATPSTDQKFYEGKRNQELTSLAGKLRNTGLSDQALMEALIKENESRCVPPLERDEVERIARSVVQYPSHAMGAHETEIIARTTLDLHFAGGDHLIYATDGNFWSYDGKKWGQLSAPVLENLTLSVMRGLPQLHRQAPSSVLKQVTSLLKAEVAINDDRLGFTQPPPVINCQNGELWVGRDGSVTLRPHSHKSYLRHCLDVSFDPNATCPLFDKAIADIFSKAKDPKAMIDFWLELMGYIIQPSREIPVIVICTGSGSNGKTAMANTIQKLIGPSLVMAMPIEDFDKSRFMVGNLVGKLLFLDDDVRAGIKLPDGLLKKLSESKTLSGEQKYGPTFNFTCLTVPMLLCNNPPSLADLSYGMMRRLVLVPFDRSFAKHEIDLNLFQTIWTTEMSGVLNHAVDGLRRVLQRKRFAYPPEMEAAKSRWLSSANPVPAFVDECCVEEGSCAIGTLYEAYTQWCRDSGITSPQQRLNFKRNLENLGYKAGRDAKARKIIGLSLRLDPNG